MIPLFQCACCGFLSTRACEFRTHEGLLADKSCLAKIEAKADPHVDWFRCALEHVVESAKPSTWLQPVVKEMVRGLIREPAEEPISETPK